MNSTELSVAIKHHDVERRIHTGAVSKSQGRSIAIELLKNEKVYNKKNNTFDMNDALPGIKYCVKCKTEMELGSQSYFKITADGVTKLNITTPKYLLHCSGGCSWTCTKLNYCFRCGHDRNGPNDCSCNKWATPRETYIWENLLGDIANNLDLLKN